MPSTIKINTTDCGDIEITANLNIKTSTFIDGYLSDMGMTDEYIDLTSMGHHEMTAAQARRFYAVWEFLNSPAGAEYLERANIDYWQYRNFKLDDCLDQPLKDMMKATEQEREEVKADLVRATVVPYSELETNEHTKEFLDKGYVGMQHTAYLMTYANFLGNELCIKLFAGCFAGHLKRLVKVFPTPPPNTGSDDKPGLEVDQPGFVEETVVSMVSGDTTSQQTTSEPMANGTVVSMEI